MSTPRQYLVGAVAAALAIPIALSGCVMQSDSEVTSGLQKTLASQVPHATGAVVGLASDGAERTVAVRLYVDDDQPAVVTAAVDKAVGLAWAGMPSEPSSVVISVVDGAEPAGASTSDSGGLDLSAAAADLGFRVPGIGRDSLIIYRSELAKKYGSWHAPATQ
ncbi:MAG: hypothetical protein JWN80_1306 [Microbacteriaceae bacterium]|jgi:type 1 fimbria pilin|nr:hypothetical protein [Microbacteriaceae bacterium]